MEITEIKISLFNDDRLKGFVNIILDDLFVVRGLKIIRGLNGYFVAMPSRRHHDGTFRDIAHPTKPSFREKLEKKILEKYWAEYRRLNPEEILIRDYSL